MERERRRKWHIKSNLAESVNVHCVNKQSEHGFKVRQDEGKQQVHKLEFLSHLYLG